MADPAPHRPVLLEPGGGEEEAWTPPAPPPEPATGAGDRLDQLRTRLGLDRRLLVWAVGAVVAALVAAWLLRPAPAPFEETIPTASSSPAAAGPTVSIAPADGAASTPSTASEATEVVAHAAGAVVRPGVYRLDPTARVDDLVRAAGGLTLEADPTRLNLAAPVADGARVYVPAVGEEAPPEVATPEGATPRDGSTPDAPTGVSAGEGVDPTQPININAASETELDELPGVGPAIAAAIVAYRTESGGFTSVDELLEVRGIGEAKLAEIAPLVTV